MVEFASNDMPQQAPLRIIKTCRLYVPGGQWNKIPHVTRGIYILYKKKPPGRNRKTYEVFYIGAAGVAKNGKSGIRGRIKNHHKTKKTGWTHYSFFEVHDNVSHEEILELESLFLHIFRHDPRIRLDNVQFGSGKLRNLSKDSDPAWPSNQPT